MRAQEIVTDHVHGYEQITHAFAAGFVTLYPSWIEFVLAIANNTLSGQQFLPASHLRAHSVDLGATPAR